MVGLTPIPVALMWVGPEAYGRWRFMGGLVNGLILGALFYKIGGDNV